MTRRARSLNLSNTSISSQEIASSLKSATMTAVVCSGPRRWRVTVQHPRGHGEDVVQLKVVHQLSSCNRRSERSCRARFSSSRRLKCASDRRCSTNAAIASRATSDTERPSTAATVRSRSANSGSNRNSVCVDVRPGRQAVGIASEGAVDNRQRRVRGNGTLEEWPTW
jgi:hypothetical protein